MGSALACWGELGWLLFAFCWGKDGFHIHFLTFHITALLRSNFWLLQQIMNDQDVTMDMKLKASLTQCGLELQCLCASIVQCQHPSPLCPCQPGASLSPLSPLHIPVVSLPSSQDTYKMKEVRSADVIRFIYLNRTPMFGSWCVAPRTDTKKSWVYIKR